jgi:hydroxymethylbilane synthase
MRIGTRRSALALAQANFIRERLGGGEIVEILTSGDRGAAEQDKSRWVSELERALEREEVDVAVHSAKDVPGELAPGLALAGAPARAGAEDVLCGAPALDRLDAGARVGTSSIRRASQLRAARADLEIVDMRGNVDTRLRKLEQGEFDAIVLARAGLQRLGREDAIGAVLDPAQFVPAPGQGALALELREDDDGVRAQLAAILDADTTTCLLAERALARALDADCHTALGAHATLRDGHLQMHAWLALDHDAGWVSDELAGEVPDPQALGDRLAERIVLAASAAAAGTAGAASADPMKGHP